MPVDVAATVLIVDDHAGFRTFARALLEAEGFDVVGEAADGESALALTRTLAPDLVLLDVAPPDMDGFAVCEALLEDGRSPAVVLTSSRSRALHSDASSNLSSYRMVHSGVMIVVVQKDRRTDGPAPHGPRYIWLHALLRSSVGKEGQGRGPHGLPSAGLLA